MDADELAPVDAPLLISRFRTYAHSAGVRDDVIQQMSELLGSPLGLALIGLPSEQLHARLVNDAYKPKMHNMYSQFFSAVECDFALNVRRSPVPLADVRSQHPELYEGFLAATASISSCPAWDDACDGAVRLHLGFKPHPTMLARMRENGVAPVEWCEGGEPAVASGSIEAASLVETSMMQTVQRVTILAQVAAIREATGHAIPRLERLASSLGKLALTVQRLNAAEHGMRLALFAGRRSSDRLFLLLQNLTFMRLVEGYVGTSSAYVVTLMEEAMLRLRWAEAARTETIGRLVGTHAHEQSAVAAQLLADADDEAGDGHAPCCVSTLLVHMLFLLANGGLASATALADTFGTAAFCATAAAAVVPLAFVRDMADAHGDKIPEGARVIDLIRVWRVDSGDYAVVAEGIVAACERRAAARTAEGLPAVAPPVLMHSNLGSVEEILEVAKLPDRIRPSILGFGTLADGFLPFMDGEREHRLELASVVMKAVQARVPGRGAGRDDVCASKLGDASDGGKAQLDPRLDGAAQQRIKDRLMRMSAHRDVDSGRVSRVLSRIYEDVTRRYVFSGGDAAVLGSA